MSKISITYSDTLTNDYVIADYSVSMNNDISKMLEYNSAAKNCMRANTDSKKDFTDFDQNQMK